MLNDIMRKRNFLNWVYIGLGIFGILALLSVGGMFFIFGEDTLAVVGLMEQGAEDGRQNDLRDSDVALDEEGNVVDSGAAGECVTFPVSQKVRKNDRVMLG